MPVRSDRALFLISANNNFLRTHLTSYTYHLPHITNNLLLRAFAIMVAPQYYVFTGRAGGEVIPRHVTHVRIALALKFVRARAFLNHPNIKKVICHDGVVKIEEKAFFKCPRLRRVIMPGVKVIGQMAFEGCKALRFVECGKLERIGYCAFRFCKSLRNVELPSIKIVDGNAFERCKKLTRVNFGKDLKSIGGTAFCNCISLERITIPLKDDIITSDSIFIGCKKLNHVDLVEGEHETIAALLLEEWKNDMIGEIERINRVLPNTHAGTKRIGDMPGEKAREIRTWIRSVRPKIIHYKAEHRRILNEAAATLENDLPSDIVYKNVLPFLELPLDTFERD